MKAVKILLVIAVVLVLVAAGGLFWLTRFLNTPEFKAQLRDAAREAVGAELDIGELQVSIFRGITVRDVRVGNPEGFTGDLMTAKSFVLHYRLWPLLRKRVEVETLTLDSPVFTLAKNPAGDWNYDKIGGEEKPGATPPPAGAPAPKTASSLDVSISRVEMKDATLVMLSPAGSEWLRITDANFSSNVELRGDQLTGAGQTRIDLVNAADSLFVRKISAPVAITTEAVKLAPVTGKVADGAVTGDVALELTGAARYLVNLQVKDADVVKMLQEAGVTKKAFSSGKLQLTTALTGTGGLETVQGTGKAEITGGQLVEVPLLGLLSFLLQVDVLQNLRFDECVMEYTIADNVMQTPVINLKSPQVQITGAGKVALSDYSLDHTMTLVLAAGALERAPKEVRNVFTRRDDGSFAIDFKVWGPYDKPKTDLDRRIIRGVGEQLLEKGLQKFLK